MADTAAKPKRQDAALKAMLREGQRDKERQAEQLAIARAAKAEKRAKRIKAKVETGPRPVAKAGEAVRPGRGGMALRYHLAGQINGAQYSAAVEYADLHWRCRDTKISSYGDTRGGGDGTGVLTGRMRSRTVLNRANEMLDRQPLPTRHLVEAVCVEDWAASDWLRDIDLDPNLGLPMLRKGLDALAAHWRLPEKRTKSG